MKFDFEDNLATLGILTMRVIFFFQEEGLLRALSNVYGSHADAGGCETSQWSAGSQEVNTFFPPLWSKKEGTTNWSRRIPLGVSDRRPFGVLFPWGRSAVQMSTTLSSETGGILIALQLLPLQKGFALSLKVMMSDIYCWKILQSLDKDQVGFYLSFLKDFSSWEQRIIDPSAPNN